MPGIAGIISREPALECRRRVTLMLQTMMHERSYVSGNCSAPEFGVYAGWVAHPGSFADTQSGRHADGKIDLALAGECVQDEDLLTLYQRLGADAIQRLNGLFSGLLIDRQQRRALLFIDRYGVERLYVHETRDALYFASEAKAILSVMPSLRAFDDVGVAEFLTFGCPVNGHTLFRGIRLLEGGSMLAVDAHSFRKTRYFEPHQWECQRPLTPDEFDTEFQQRFSEAMPRYLRGERRLGLSLTGGLDTRMIIAASSTRARKPTCYTFCGLDGQTLDARIAARVAAACGLEHRLVRIGTDFLANFSNHVDRTVYVTDGCSGPLGAHEMYLNAQVRDLAPVRLTGNFGSEVLRSVSTFKPRALSPELISPEFHSAMRVVGEQAWGNASSSVTFAAFREIPWNLFGTVAAAKSQVVFRTPYLDNDLVALAYRTPAAVRRSAGAALRFINETYPAISAVPTDRGLRLGRHGPVYLLNRVASEVTFKLDYFHSEELPRPLIAFDRAIGAVGKAGGVLGLHKYLPYRRWFRDVLADYITDAVSASAARGLPYWNAGALRVLASEHVSGKRNRIRELNAVITLTAVYEQLLRSRHTGVRPGSTSSGTLAAVAWAASV